MPKKMKRELSLGTVLFWMIVVFSVAAYFYAVPRDQWFGSRNTDIERETEGDNIFQSGPNPYIYNPNNAPIRNPNNWGPVR